MIILGDFNKNWLDKSATKDKNNFENFNLTQLIKEPNRVTSTSQSLIDWILVTHLDLLKQVSCLIVLVIIQLFFVYGKLKF